MEIEDINQIYQEAHLYKQQAINRVSDYKYFIKASKKFKKAIDYTSKLPVNGVGATIQRDVFVALYTYEYNDCIFAYSIKTRNFKKANQYNKLQETLLEQIIEKYSQTDIEAENVKFIYNRFPYFLAINEFQLNFQTAKQYFDAKEYYLALQYFNLAKINLNNFDLAHIENDLQLKVHRQNSFIIDANISSCMMGVSTTDSSQPRRFLITFIVRQIVISIQLADKLIDLTNDHYYDDGKNTLLNNLRSILFREQELWKDILNENGENDLVSRFCIEIDSNLYYQIMLSLGYPGQLEYRLLFSVHGFNTRGEWKNDLTTVVSADEPYSNVRFIQVPWDYGVFKYVKFLTPVFRKMVYADFALKYEDTINLYGSRVTSNCLVAHSFGTRITSYSMVVDSAIKFHRIIFAGSVLRRDFDWDFLKNKGQCDRVLFEINSKDVALTWAGRLSTIPWIKWIGNAGKKGLDKAYSFVETVYGDGDHSDMLTKKVFQNRWLPFLKS